MTWTGSLVSSDEAFRALVPEWHDLCRLHQHISPFQTPAWMLNWWRRFGTGMPRVGVLRNETGTLAGLLPLYILEQPGERKLLPMGAGVTDYVDAVLSAESPPHAASTLLAVILSRACKEDIHICDLSDLPPDSAILECEIPQGWIEKKHVADVCPVLRATDGCRFLEECVPRGTLRHLRNARHRANRSGGYQVEINPGTNASACWNTIADLHRARWQGLDGGNGVFTDLRVADFHSDAVAALAETGLLRLGVIRIDGRMAAGCYALASGPDRILFYLSGYDPSFSHVSPGTILLGAMIEWALQEGRNEIHFLRGNEPYKYAWGATDRVNTHRRLVRGTV